MTVSDTSNGTPQAVPDLAGASSTAATIFSENNDFVSLENVALPLREIGLNKGEGGPSYQPFL